MNQETFKTSIGGQAVMEGLAMKGPKKTCLAIRLSDGSIYQELSDTPVNPFAKIPLLRGVASFVLALKSGYYFLLKSSEFVDDEPSEGKIEQYINEKVLKGNNSFLNWVVALLAGALSIGLFFFLPTLITSLLSKLLGITQYLNLIEGLVKLVIFISYIALASRVKEINRVFRYHGAEHKTIFCFEQQLPLTVENVRKCSRFHPRCGTSFMFISLLLSILVFSLIPWTSTGIRVLLKLVTLPLIMSLSFECIRYSGRHDNLLSKILSFPGLLIQRLTVFEPDDEMIEVAITSLNAVLPEDLSEASL